MDEDDVVAMQMGARDARSLTEKQSFYLDKIKAKLAQVIIPKGQPSSWMNK